MQDLWHYNYVDTHFNKQKIIHTPQEHVLWLVQGSTPWHQGKHTLHTDCHYYE